MSIRVNIPSYLQPYSDGAAVVEVKGSTIGECFSHLVKQFPGMESMLFAQAGKLHDFIGVYLNGEDAYPDELAKAIKDGDELHFLYLMGGG